MPGQRGREGSSRDRTTGRVTSRASAKRARYHGRGPRRPDYCSRMHGVARVIKGAAVRAHESGCNAEVGAVVVMVAVEWGCSTGAHEVEGIGSFHATPHWAHATGRARASIEQSKRGFLHASKLPGSTRQTAWTRVRMSAASVVAGMLTISAAGSAAPPPRSPSTPPSRPLPASARRALPCASGSAPPGSRRSRA